jgi:hypothetical protein
MVYFLATRLLREQGAGPTLSWLAEHLPKPPNQTCSETHTSQACPGPGPDERREQRDQRDRCNLSKRRVRPTHHHLSSSHAPAWELRQ